MANAKIEITTQYSDGTTRQVDSNDTSLPGTLEGDASATETKVRFSGADAQGRPATVTRRAVAPAGQTFRSATITMRLNCDPPKTATPVTLTGNVSVSGRVDGECVVVTAVNSTGDPVTGVEQITETSVRSCCKAPGGNASFEDPVLLDGLAKMLDDRFDLFRTEIVTLMGASGNPEDGRTDNPEDFASGMGVWLGLGFKADAGLQVAGALPGSPASASTIKKGDVVRAVNGKSVETLDQLMTMLAELSILEPAGLTVLRDDETEEVKVDTSPRLLPNGDMISAFTMNRACGEDCECSRTVTRAICGKGWRYLGEHESGALAYEEQCITINPRVTPVKTVHVCGLALFI